MLLLGMRPEDINRVRYLMDFIAFLVIVWVYWARLRHTQCVPGTVKGMSELLG